MDLNGTAALVTGGASGLGNATAGMPAKHGAKVAIFDLNEEAGAKAAAEIGAAFVKVNVADEASVLEGLASAEAAHGVVRVLVNCAGVAPAIRRLDGAIRMAPR